LVQTQTELTTVVTSFLCLSRTDLTRFHFEFHQNGFETTLALGGAVLLQSFGERAFPVIVQSKVETLQREIAASLMKCKMRTALFWVITQSSGISLPTFRDKLLVPF
jgi:hypothetical protein